jgi:DNA repair protein RecO (recombination protein O)
MPTIRDDAFCVRHWDFSETSQTVSIFGREHGLIRGLAKGARRERGSFSGGFDLFTRGEIVAIQKPGRELATLTEWTLQETFPILRQSLPANRAAWYFADLVVRFIHHPEPHPRSWDAFHQALRALQAPEHEGVTPEATMLSFQWRVLDDLGYRPRLTLDGLPGEETVAFDPRSGGIVEDTGHQERWRVRRATVALLEEVQERSGEVPRDSDPESIRRANRLLGAWVRELMGKETVPMRMVFES